MGNSSSRDERRQASVSQQASARQSPGQQQQTSADRLAASIYAVRNASARGSRHDISFLHMGRGDRDRDGEAAAPERPRETKQEREARRAEKERQARLKERERSMREEHVDGGYLVTVGVYTGPEDFNKAVVRQLMIERRLAPFWKGLDDHNDSWTEAQLVAAARGLPIPAPDEVPPEMARTGSQASSNPRTSDTNINSLTVPITSRSQSYQSDRSASLSASHPAFSSTLGADAATNSSPSNLFRGRAKTLASLASGKSQSPDLTPQEIRLPNDRAGINGQQLEVYLYKDASECPICFLYYPPYLNRTRCCDQSICSECFVQIKRPDPHPPEHEQPGQQRPPEEEAETLVSEVAACPFCVTPEFGVTYEPPPFRRGLAYAHMHQNGLKNPTSAMSSSSSLTSGGGAAGRRRATSVSATSSNVVTTDRVRPDWAKKLADARANALRRSAAATALHNAAYVLGNQGERQPRGGLIGRRRRTLFESPAVSGGSTPREGRVAISYEDFVRITNRQRQGDGNGGEANGNDIAGGRTSSRRNRVEDLEELMMMEAIRLSLEAEEERKRREEKEAQKEAKKKAKADRKEEKKAEKAERKRGGSGSLHHTATNDSNSSTWASTSMMRSTSNLGAQQTIPEAQEVQGKGKQPAQDFAGFNPLSEPTSTLNMGTSENKSASPPASPVTASSKNEDSQRHLETARAHLPQTSTTTQNSYASPNSPTPLSRQLSNHSEQSNVSSAASSSAESSHYTESNMPLNSSGGLDASAGAQQESAPVSGNGNNNESMFNFGSLAAMVDHDKGREGEHVERVETAMPASQTMTEHKKSTPATSGEDVLNLPDGNRSRGSSGESSGSAPPVYAEHALHKGADAASDDDKIAPAASKESMHLPDSKEIGNVSILGQDHDQMKTSI